MPEGLSPRLRGNLNEKVYDYAGRGSIPAPAREPASNEPVSKNGRVYPRACGGTMTALHVNALYVGLSPRLRGNLV